MTQLEQMRRNIEIDYMLIADFLEEYWIEFVSHCDEDRSAARVQVNALRKMAGKKRGFQMTIDLDTLEALAKAATPGPWEDMGNHPDHLHGAVNKGNKHIALCNHYESAEPTKTVTAEEMRANAAFIAAANPAVVLELVTELRKARAAQKWIAHKIVYRHDACAYPCKCGGCPPCEAECVKCWLKAAHEFAEGKQ